MAGLQFAGLAGRLLPRTWALLIARFAAAPRLHRISRSRSRIRSRIRSRSRSRSRTCSRFPLTTTMVAAVTERHGQLPITLRVFSSRSSCTSSRSRRHTQGGENSTRI